MTDIANDAATIAKMRGDRDLQARIARLRQDFVAYRYTYNFTWMDRPIIQLPEDIVMLQEIIWRTGPEAVVETGVAHGGSLVFYASMLQLLGGDRFAVGVEIELRAANRAALAAHPLADRLRLVDGSSVDPDVAARVYALCAGRKKVLVILDSNHTHEHVLAELRLYAPLVQEGGYLVVLDTAIEDLPDGLYENRPWNKLDNPKTAVRAFLRENDRFVVDKAVEDRLLFTVAPEGYLRCVKNG
jgi:cephalosporin hydroxylase